MVHIIRSAIKMVGRPMGKAIGNTVEESTFVKAYAAKVLDFAIKRSYVQTKPFAHVPELGKFDLGPTWFWPQYESI